MTLLVFGDVRKQALLAALFVSTIVFGAAGCKPHGDEASAEAADAEAAQAASARGVDVSGRTRVGNASFYARKLAGKEMADGSKMDPRSDNAASKTLPLGTTATVTNTETGQSAVVTIRDRGPYVKDRIVDLSPSTARKIGITPDEGVAKVKVAPITIPLPDGTTRGPAPSDKNASR